ncbi:MAG: hypothetical protein QOE77_3837 [Blastocatellia bacterium]|nr:hypothetical protein [Blastocatellia bacterium]
MKHLLIMLLFSGLVAVVFGAVGKGTPRDRALYGVKVFAEFVVIGMALAWLLYFLPIK